MICNAVISRHYLLCFFLFSLAIKSLDYTQLLLQSWEHLPFVDNVFVNKSAFNASADLYK